MHDKEVVKPSNDGTKIQTGKQLVDARKLVDAKIPLARELSKKLAAHKEKKAAKQAAKAAKEVIAMVEKTWGMLKTKELKKDRCNEKKLKHKKCDLTNIVSRIESMVEKIRAKFNNLNESHQFKLWFRVGKLYKHLKNDEDISFEDDSSPEKDSSSPEKDSSSPEKDSSSPEKDSDNQETGKCQDGLVQTDCVRTCPKTAIGQPACSSGCGCKGHQYLIDGNKCVEIEKCPAVSEDDTSKSDEDNQLEMQKTIKKLLDDIEKILSDGISILHLELIQEIEEKINKSNATLKNMQACKAKSKLDHRLNSLKQWFIEFVEKMMGNPTQDNKKGFEQVEGAKKKSAEVAEKKVLII
jgi:hypothetical protein